MPEITEQISPRERRMAIVKQAASSWIQTTPGVCGGEPCIRTTRHTVAGLVAWKQQGLTEARILQHHPDLTLEDLTVAWAYYADHRVAIDQALQDEADA